MDRMAVMGVWAFTLCKRHRWHYKTKEQRTMKTYQADFPWTENKEVFCFTLSVSGTQSFDWNLDPLISAQIVNSFGQGKCIFDCQSGNLKTMPLQATCLNKLMLFENWNTDHLQRYLYVDISYKFNLAWVFLSHSCTQITINTFINDLVFFTVMILC